MAYDRSDRSRWSDDDFDRERARRDDRGFSDRGRGGDEDRGFFERAGEQMRNWFGGDDDDRGGRGDWREREQRGDRPERGSDRGDEGWHSPRGDDRQRASRGDQDYRPMAGDYGRSGGGRRADQRGRMSGGGNPRDNDRDRGQSNWDRDEYRNTSFAGSSEQSNYRDRHYHEQRQRHMDEFDRDYHDYHRERQSKFEGDFGGWRERRQSKRQLLGQIREQMEVVGKDGAHVGTIDRVAGDRIILAKSDPDSGGVHHSLSCTDFDRIEGDKLMLDCTAEQAKQRCRDEDRERALFEPEDQGEAGPHILDRSFSGTYR